MTGPAQLLTENASGKASHGAVLVFDGGCPFCRSFALRSELHGGLPGLGLRDGRVDNELRRELRRSGFDLNRGAVLITGDQVLHGAEAIQWLCEHMRPSDALLRLLTSVLAAPRRARALYPLLLLARRLALTAWGLPLDPDR
jgi:predicted DCC family thiol-disulfide oxidoreductase YuxK